MVSGYRTSEHFEINNVFSCFHHALINKHDEQRFYIVLAVDLNINCHNYLIFSYTVQDCFGNKPSICVYFYAGHKHSTCLDALTSGLGWRTGVNLKIGHSD